MSIRLKYPVSVRRLRTTAIMAKVVLFQALVRVRSLLRLKIKRSTLSRLQDQLGHSALSRSWNVDRGRSLSVGLSAGQFRSFKSGIYATDEMDLHAEYTWSKALKLTAALAVVRDRLGDENGERQLRFNVSYAYAR